MKSFKQYLRLKENLGSGSRIGLSPSSGMGNFRSTPAPPPPEGPSTDDEWQWGECDDCGPNGQPGEWHIDHDGNVYFYGRNGEVWVENPDGSWDCLNCDQDAITPDPPSTDDPSDEEPEPEPEPDEDEDEDEEYPIEVEPDSPLDQLPDEIGWPPGMAAQDMNGDGVIDFNDWVLAWKYYNEHGEGPPWVHPGPGGQEPKPPPRWPWPDDEDDSTIPIKPYFDWWDDWEKYRDQYHDWQQDRPWWVQ